MPECFLSMVRDTDKKYSENENENEDADEMR